MLNILVGVFLGYLSMNCFPNNEHESMLTLWSKRIILAFIVISIYNYVYLQGVR